MKFYLTYLLKATVAVAVLSSCTVKETLVGWAGEGDVSAKDVTYATFSFSVAGTSKTSMTSDADESESLLSTRMMIYEHTTGNDGVCEVDTTYMTASVAIPVSPGEKRIFVIANEHDKSWRIPNQKGHSLREMIIDKNPARGGHLFLHEIDFGTPALSSSELIEPLTSVDYSDLVKPYMVFSNSQADSASIRTVLPNVSQEETLNSPGDSLKNHFRISMQRAVAKVTVFCAANLNYTENDYISGDYDDLYWGVRNQNRAVALFRKTVEGGRVSPPFFDLSWPSDISDYKPYWWTGDVAGEDVNIPMDLGASVANYYYVPENVYGSTGNSTYIVVKANFKPAYCIDRVFFNEDKGTVSDVETLRLPAHQTYYTINYNASPETEEASAITIDLFRLNNLIAVGQPFTNIEEARRVAYFLEHDGDISSYPAGYEPVRLKIETHENGISYYRFDISNNADGGLLRNKQYRGKITSFGGVGAARIELLDEIKPMSIGGRQGASGVQIMSWDTLVLDLK